MNITNLKKASDFEVQEWFFKSIKELTPYQKQKIVDDEIVRFSPYNFFKRKKQVKNFWLRLTIIFIPIVLVVLIIGLPFRFIIKGEWGYDYRSIEWYSNWLNAVGI